MDVAPDSLIRDPEPAPWSLRATLGISALIILANFLCGIVTTAGYVASMQNTDVTVDPSRLISNGTLVTLSILFSSPVIFGLTFLFVSLRKGPAIKEYLGFHEVDWKRIVKWSLILVLFAGGSDLMTFLMGRSIVQDFMSTIYATATSKPLLWTAFVVAAPVSEEVFFRGFLFYGIMKSRLGPMGAVFLSSLIWAPLHIQYDLYGILTVLVLGLLFGYARLKTNSVYIPIAMHALMNFIASMEVMVQIVLQSPAS